MTQFQAFAILMPVFVLVVLVAVARWTQYQDRAPEDPPVQPKPAQREDDEAIDDLAGDTETAASERNVDVIANPSTERDMPALPEFLEIAREIGPTKVLRQSDAEHAGQADGNVTVPTEIEKNADRNNNTKMAPICAHKGRCSTRGFKREDAKDYSRA